jgi:hypothetical protein
MEMGLCEGKERKWSGQAEGSEGVVRSGRERKLIG